MLVLCAMTLPLGKTNSKLDIVSEKCKFLGVFIQKYLLLTNIFSLFNSFDSVVLPRPYLYYILYIIYIGKIYAPIENSDFDNRLFVLLLQTKKIK